jgi:hypothetical protein
VRAVGQNGLAAKAWFNNTPTNSGGSTNRPSLSVNSYVYNKSVTVTASKLAPGVKYTVWIGSPRYNRYIPVGTLTSPAGGTLSATFNLPVRVHNLRRIYILLQDPTIPCSVVLIRSACVTYTVFSNLGGSE